MERVICPTRNAKADQRNALAYFPAATPSAAKRHLGTGIARRSPFWLWLFGKSEGIWGKIRDVRGRMVPLGISEGYYVPSCKGKGRAVVVLHEWWGLSEHIKDVAERFGEAGYSALAPDFFRGRHVGDVDTASECMLALTEKEVVDVLEGVWRYLSEEGTVEWGKVGVVGFGMGGAIAVYSASVYPEVVGACVTFYGIHPNIIPVWSALKAPVLAFFGGQDAVISAEIRRDFARRLQEVGVLYQEVVYPSAEHGFFNDDRPEVYDAEASADGWERLLKFLTLHLDWQGVPTGEL